MKAPAKTTKAEGASKTEKPAAAKPAPAKSKTESVKPDSVKPDTAKSDTAKPAPRAARTTGQMLASDQVLGALGAALKPDPAPEPAPPPPAPVEAEAPAPAPAAPEVPPGPMRPMPPPKPLGNPGKDFKAGDHVVYPTHGVGQVQGIEEIPIAGTTLKVIIITFEENRMTLKVPMAKAASSGLRKLASPKVMDEAMDTLKGRARIKRTMWSRRAQEYEQKINSGDPIAIAEVVRDLHRNAGQPDQSFSERQIYELALERLTAEVAARDGTDKTAATLKLMETLKTVA